MDGWLGVSFPLFFLFDIKTPPCIEVLWLVFSLSLCAYCTCDMDLLVCTSLHPMCLTHPYVTLCFVMLWYACEFPAQTDIQTDRRQITASTSPTLFGHGFDFFFTCPLPFADGMWKNNMRWEQKTVCNDEGCVCVFSHIPNA
jgi:hypothetical protein